jgi:O-antigen/teichoic acid export membrane protein
VAGYVSAAKELGALARRALGASSPLVAGRLASAALTFALPLMLARLLSADAFGTYKHFFLVAMTVQLTGQLGLTQSLYYFVPRGGPGRGAFVTQTVLAMFVLGVLVALGLWLGGAHIGRWLGDPTLATLRWPLGLFAGLSLMATPIEGALTSEGRIGGAALSYVLSDGVRAAAMVAGTLHAGAHGLFWAAAATAMARVLALLLVLLVGTVPSGRPSRRRFSAQLAYALPFAGASYLYVAQRYFAQYAVSASFDAATFALFTVALFHLPVVDIVFTPISEIMMVQIGRAQHERRPDGPRAAWDDAVSKLSAILFPAAACAWLFGPTLLPLLFTHRYDASVPLFMLASLEIPLWVLPLDALLRAAGATRFLFGFYATRVVVTGLLVIGGIKLLGLPGAVAGGVASEALARAGMLWRARAFLGVPLCRTCDLRLLARTAGAALAAYLPAWLTRHLIVGELPSLMAAMLVYAVTYVVLAASWLRPKAAPDDVAAAAAL